MQIARVVRADGLQDGDMTIDGQPIVMELPADAQTPQVLKIGNELIEVSPSDLIVVMR